MKGITDRTLAYEGGTLTALEVIELFGELIKNGMAWTLQGCYGRQAQCYIDAGMISKDGKVNYELLDKLETSV